MKRAFLFALTCALLMHAIVGAQQAPVQPIVLPYANSYLTTGNYVSGAVDFPGNAGVNGMATGTIHIAQADGSALIPSNSDGSPADILAAWVYWETIVNDASSSWNHTFPGNSISVIRFKTK